jgi:hypothetical protein
MVSPITKLFLIRLLAEEQNRLQEAGLHTTEFDFVVAQLSVVRLSNSILQL